MVTGIKREASGFGVSGWISATAAPVNDRALTFKVTDTGGKISDGYIPSYWLRGFTPQLNDIIERSYGKGRVYTENTRLGIEGALQDQQNNSMKNKPLVDALKDYPGMIGLNLDVISRVAVYDNQNDDGLRELVYDLHTIGLRDLSISSSYKRQTGENVRCVVGRSDIGDNGDILNLPNLCEETR